MRNQPIHNAPDAGTLINLQEASRWATSYLKRSVTVSNISYLVQYGRITKYSDNGSTQVLKEELREYYDSLPKEDEWKKKLGSDLNWNLSFTQYSEAERTKHVHRLHPYKGKFIPQLVEYFLDSHTDEFKTEAIFKPGDVVLDPFCGSGTTLVQANELGMHAVGVDISEFNSLISNVKISKHDFQALTAVIGSLTFGLKEFQKDRNNVQFEENLLAELAVYNAKYFPSPKFKRQVRNGEIDEKTYAGEKDREFLNLYNELVKKYQIKILQDKSEIFLDRWFLFPVREEIDFMFDQISRIENKRIKSVLAIILSRTVRSCRATTHADLATLKEPVTATYYCKKHGKICKPIFSIKGWWERYSVDTVKRLKTFDRIRTDTLQRCITGDSREIDLFEAIEKRDDKFAKTLKNKKFRGIFSSPPYVGLIDYHEQHAYAYDLFGFDRRDGMEIGPLRSGQGRESRESYVRGVAEVLINCKKYLQDDYDIFLVANDKYNIYPRIADLAGMKVVKRFKRPVLCRVEKDRSNYSETIFHLKE